MSTMAGEPEREGDLDHVPDHDLVDDGLCAECDEADGNNLCGGPPDCPHECHTKARPKDRRGCQFDGQGSI